jgi:hypothetical protein
MFDSGWLPQLRNERPFSHINALVYNFAASPLPDSSRSRSVTWKSRSGKSDPDSDDEDATLLKVCYLTPTEPIPLHFGLEPPVKNGLKGSGGFTKSE